MNLPEPILQPIPGEDKLWILHEDFVTEVLGCRITVKRDFKTDGASIPRLAWIVGHPFEGKTMPGAVVHDGLYSSELMPRDKCDMIFKILLDRYKESDIKATVYYRAVRMFGWLTWRTHTGQSIHAARKFVSIEDHESA